MVLFAYQKSQFWKALGMENLVIFYDHLISVWFFPRFRMLYLEKPGNPDEMV
jgi:hypothetical protein